MWMFTKHIWMSEMQSIKLFSLHESPSNSIHFVNRRELNIFFVYHSRVRYAVCIVFFSSLSQHSIQLFSVVSFYFYLASVYFYFYRNSNIEMKCGIFRLAIRLYIVSRRRSARASNIHTRLINTPKRSVDTFFCASLACSRVESV